MSPPDFPGQAEYYFEDEEPKRNRSGTITVTTAKGRTDFGPMRMQLDRIPAPFDELCSLKARDVSLS